MANNNNLPNYAVQQALEGSQRDVEEERMAQLHRYLSNEDNSYRESLAINEAVGQSSTNEMRRIFNESVREKNARNAWNREEKRLAEEQRRLVEKQRRIAEEEARRLAKEQRRAAALAEEARKAEEKKRAEEQRAEEKRLREQMKAAVAKQKKKEKAMKVAEKNANNNAFLNAAIAEAKLASAAMPPPPPRPSLRQVQQPPPALTHRSLTENNMEGLNNATYTREMYLKNISNALRELSGRGGGRVKTRKNRRATRGKKRATRSRA